MARLIFKPAGAGMGGGHGGGDGPGGLGGGGGNAPGHGGHGGLGGGIGGAGRGDGRSGGGRGDRQSFQEEERMDLLARIEALESQLASAGDSPAPPLRAPAEQPDYLATIIEALSSSIPKPEAPRPILQPSAPTYLSQPTQPARLPSNIPAQTQPEVAYIPDPRQRRRRFLSLDSSG